jgi:uncharacterized protein (TIGR00369 family)
VKEKMEEKTGMRQMLDLLREIYEKTMPFDRLLGVKVASLSLTDVQVRIDMREELIGNFIRRILHGGVISSVLDLTGGLVASVELLKHMENQPVDEIKKRLMRMGTIDLRVDYLRVGEGEYFLASGTVLRRGNRVAVVRTELCNDKNLLIAAGTGTYLVA